MGQLGFYMDMRRCIGCKTCQVACKDKNNLEPGIFFRRVLSREVENNSRLRLGQYSAACNHCGDPLCIAVCPTGAMHKNPDNTVGHHLGKCIGCGACVWGCPYGAPALSGRTGVSQKCDSCADLRSDGKNPACVDACLTRCLHFGDVTELAANYGPQLVRQIPGLPEETQTNPSLLIHPVPADSLGEPVDFHSILTPQEAQAAPFRRDTGETFVVLGGGAAGLAAVEAIRERNYTARVVLVSEERQLPYSRPMLTKTPLRGYSTDTYSTYSAQWYRDNHVELLAGCRAVALDAQAKTVALSDRQLLRYNKCIYALGAECFVPPIPGSDKAGVVTIRRGEDIEKVRRILLKAKRAVVIGGGVIGLEMACELRKAGLEVTVMELAPRLMERLLDAETAGELAKAVSRCGIQVLTGAKITGIGGDEWADTVLLEGGIRHPAQLVILSTGIAPNIRLLRDAGVETRRGAVVNTRMETSALGLYACGDCAEYDGINTGTWTQALAQGRIAGACAAGESLDYVPLPSPILLHAAETSLFSIGDLGKQPQLHYETRAFHHTQSTQRLLVNSSTFTQAYEKYYFTQGRLVGAALLGDLSKMQAVTKAVQEHHSIEKFLAEEGMFA